MLAPTICSNQEEPIRRESTRGPNERHTVPIDSNDRLLLSNDSLPLPPNFRFEYVSPDVIESDYWGTMSYLHTGHTHVAVIVNNPLKPVKDMSILGESNFHFDGSFGKAYNEVLMGMIYQWKLSTLELLDAVIRQGCFEAHDVRNQKSWVYSVVARLMKAVQQFHHYVPLGVLKKELLMSYLPPNLFFDGDELEFLFQMAGCEKYEVISSCIDFRTSFIVCTRFDGDNNLLFAFGY